MLKKKCWRTKRASAQVLISQVRRLPGHGCQNAKIHDIYQMQSQSSAQWSVLRRFNIGWTLTIRAEFFKCPDQRIYNHPRRQFTLDSYIISERCIVQCTYLPVAEMTFLIQGPNSFPRCRSLNAKNARDIKQGLDQNRFIVNSGARKNQSLTHSSSANNNALLQT